MNIELVRGPQADSRLADCQFRGAWDALRDQCPWGSAFQSNAFAAAWYSAYRNLYEPLLVLGFDDAGGVCGVIPLAICRASGKLIPAGAHQAEYQGWICLPDAAQTFPAEAFAAISDQFPSAPVPFRYLPAGTPLEWATEGTMRGTCLLKSFRRPLMQLGDGQEVHQSLQKSGNRNRLRQLKKLGAVEFKQITDPAEFEAVLDQAALCHDCRQLAIHGVAPFLEDDLKHAFHLAMMNAPGLLHMTVLKVGDQIASFHLNVTRGTELQLYVIAHDPRFSKYSPGKLHVLFLARMLQEQGFERIDLTPGGDEYKERFANDGDEVKRLTVYPTATRRINGLVSSILEDAGRRMLERANLTPADIRCVLGDCEPRRLFAMAGAQASRGRRWIRSTRELKVYACDLAALAPMSGQRVSRDNLRHLLAYAPAAEEPSRRSILSIAMRRFEDGQHVYTESDGGRIVIFGWLLEEPASQWAAQTLPGFDVPADSMVILNFRPPATPAERPLAVAAIETMLHDAAQAGARRVYIAVPALALRKNNFVEKAGFAYQGSIVWHTQMGRRNIRLENVPRPSLPATPAAGSIAELPKVDFQSPKQGHPRPCRKTG